MPLSLLNYLPVLNIEARNSTTRLHPTTQMVDVVVVHYRRPANIPLIIDALRAQTMPLRLTLIDVHTAPEDELPASCLSKVDEHFRWRKNHGGFNRYIAALSLSAEYTLFLDDDLLPGPHFLAHLVRQAKTLTDAGRPFGCLSQLGRLFKNGRYSSHDVPRQSSFLKIDCPVRGYFVPTRHLVHVAQVRWQEPQLFYVGMGEDDLVLSLALKRAGLPMYLTPLDDDPLTEMAAVNLPEPYALSHRSEHLKRRDKIVRDLFVGSVGDC